MARRVLRADERLPLDGQHHPGREVLAGLDQEVQPRLHLRRVSQPRSGAGALLVAASANLSPTAPTTHQFLDTLWQFQGQKFTELGGLSGPKWFAKDKFPRVPYCIFAAVANANNDGWTDVVDKPVCTSIIAPSDSMNQKDKVA